MTPTAQCARHPDRVATSVCPRCGAFTCAECNADGRSLCPACQQTTGTAGFAPTPTPWERRAELGFVQAVWQTWKQTVFEPAKFWAQHDPNGPGLDAFLYGWLISSLAGVLQIPFLILNFAQTQAQMRDLARAMKDVPSPVQAFFDVFTGSPVVLSVGLGVSSIILFPLSVLIGAGLVHVGVRMVGGTQQPFTTTLRALCYALAPNVLQGVPVVGGLVGIYTLVLEVWGIRDGHKLTTGRAIIAVMWPMVLLCCCGGGAAVILAATLASRFR
ncbi:MAG: YIP1 family protein [Myxococcaceae bacterium]|nr:YIP1 family protein [Myxococcaceae bacterium]